MDLTMATPADRVQLRRRSLDRPWHRPGTSRYAVARLRSILKPPLDVQEPEAGSLVDERDVPVVARDGTTLRVNVFRPLGDGPSPVLLSAHPYGKDRLSRIIGGRTRLSFNTG